VGIQNYEKEEFFSRTNVLGKEFMGEGMKIPFNEQFPLFNGTGPFNMLNRYITEDIPIGCCVQREFARKYNVDVPVIDSMILLASIMTKIDFNKEGWTLETLGVADLDRKALLSYVHEGEI